MEQEDIYIPNLIYAIYKRRKDLQETFNINTDHGLIAFFLWWKEHAEVNEYNYFWLPNKEFKKLFYSKGKDGIYKIHFAIALINKTFNLRESIETENFNDQKYYKIYIDWIKKKYITNFKNTYLIFPDLPGFNSKYHSLNSNLVFDSYSNNEDEITFLSDLLILLKLEKNSTNEYIENLNQKLNDKVPYLDKRNLPDLYKFFYEQIKINKKVDNPKLIYIQYLISKSNKYLIPQFLLILSHYRSDLLGVFEKESLSQEASDISNFIINWWSNFGQHEYTLGLDKNNYFLNFKKLIKDYYLDISQGKITIDVDSEYWFNNTNESFQNIFFNNLFLNNNKKYLEIEKYENSKISICGFHNYQLGISEDSRNIYKSVENFEESIKASNVPFSPINKSVKIDYPVYDFVRSEKKIIVLPPPELLNLYLINNSFFQSEIIYALVPWELENIPKYLECLFKKIDTVLAPSTFIQKVISKIHNDVKLLPHYVDINSKISSKKFETFTFTFSADMNSFVERKNPICAINAFIKFLKKNENAILILRLTNYSSYDYPIIENMIDGIDNIKLIKNPLNRKEYLTLLSRSHCYVSPHRSEGFGRNIAEAMYLGTPTIVSNYSGNLDFCTPESSFLIEGKLIPIEMHAYPFWENNNWYDPSVEHLSDLMTYVFENYELATKKAYFAKDIIKTKHCLSAYSKNLKRIIS